MLKQSVKLYNQNMEQLRDWLNEQCDRRNLTWRDASIRAGVYPGAISAIMNGQRPGLEVCKALARSFGTSPEHVLRMAGHLPPLPSGNGLPPDLIAQALEIQEIWRRVHAVDPTAAEELASIAIIQGKAFEVAVNAALRRLESEQPNQEEREGQV